MHLLLSGYEIREYQGNGVGDVRELFNIHLLLLTLSMLLLIRYSRCTLCPNIPLTKSNTMNDF